MFPRRARPCCIYKLRFLLGCDGNLKRFLQNKPSVEEWRHVPSALKKREKECKWQEKKTEDRNETKEINTSSLTGSISNLFPLQLALWEGNDNSRSSWSVASCPSNLSEHHSYPGFMFIKHRPCLQHFNKAALPFLEEIACLVSSSQTYPREFVVL